MKMVQILKGNLLESDCYYIAHGCNCQGKMNSGIAKHIREKYPNTFNAYIGFLNQPFVIPLGDYIATFEGTRIVFNLFTQEFYGRDGKQYASYEAIESSLLKAATAIVSHKIDHLPILGIPWIGCGLGGAKKDKVLEILHKIEDKIYTTIDSDRARNFQFHIYEFDG